MLKIVYLEGSKQIFTEKQWSDLSELGTFVAVPKAAEKHQVMALVKNADVLMTTWGSAAIDEEVLAQAPKLRLLVHCAGSVKGIVTPLLPYLLEHDIRVSSCNGALGQGVAETALGLTIISLKNIWSLSGYTRIGDNWSKGGGRERIKDVHDVTIGIIGASKAGKHFIRLLQNFEVQVLVYDPVISSEEIRALGAESASLERVMGESDVVSIHAPSIPATEGMIHAGNLKWMKDGAILINTARGTIIREPDLVAELETGRISACIDVTEPEPPAADHPFRKLPNVILTPHLAGLSNNGLSRIGRAAVQEIKQLVQNQPLHEEVNLHQLDIIA